MQSFLEGIISYLNLNLGAFQLKFGRFGKLLCSHYFRAETPSILSKNIVIYLPVKRSFESNLSDIVIDQLLRLIQIQIISLFVRVLRVLETQVSKNVTKSSTQKIRLSVWNSTPLYNVNFRVPARPSQSPGTTRSLKNNQTKPRLSPLLNPNSNDNLPPLPQNQSQKPPLTWTSSASSYRNSSPKYVNANLAAFHSLLQKNL